jgi:heme oxygenase
MRVNMQITHSLDVKVKKAVPRHMFKHVVKKSHPGAYVARSVPVEIDGDTYLGFFGLS